jgi:hypothetical protein
MLSRCNNNRLKQTQFEYSIVALNFMFPHYLRFNPFSCDKLAVDLLCFKVSVPLWSLLRDRGSSSILGALTKMVCGDPGGGF